MPVGHQTLINGFIRPSTDVSTFLVCSSGHAHRLFPSEFNNLQFEAWRASKWDERNTRVWTRRFPRCCLSVDVSSHLDNVNKRLWQTIYTYVAMHAKTGNKTGFHISHSSFILSRPSLNLHFSPSFQFLIIHSSDNYVQFFHLKQTPPSAT